MTPTIPAMTRTTTPRAMTTEVLAMPTVKLQFPGGRYHATPWGHHVNEGLIEWPPSPWRLLRAFIACGFSSQGWSEVPPIARRLIDKLAAVLPSYRLPEASAAHSRHFMPVGILDNGREQTTLVFDTWANVGDGELLIHWPCELDSEEVELLDKIASALGYLGRSESWVEAQLSKENSGKWNAVPCQEGEHRDPRWEQVSLMAAIPPREYLVWQNRQADVALQLHPLPKGKKKISPKLFKDREKAIVHLPSDLLSCLTKDTAWWKSHGWSQPPGSQRVLYWRRSDSLQAGVPQRSKRPPQSSVTTMLLALTTPSGSTSALPACARALPQGELFHRAIVGRVGQGQKVHCPELTGRDEHGDPLKDNHRHAHILPVDLDHDGHLDHIIVYAPMGLGDAAQHAIRTLRRTWTKGGVGDIQIAVVGSGDLDMLRQLPGKFGNSIEQLLGPTEGARIWESVTPFVTPRVVKRGGKNTLVGQINAELASRGFPAAESVVIDPDLTRELRHYVRRRNHGGTPPPFDYGCGVRIVFPKAVRGPLLIGYASHYGLGMFRPCAT